jgi:NitT/TauT family transport system substrate-binding protein
VFATQGGDAAWQLDAPTIGWEANVQREARRRARGPAAWLLLIAAATVFFSACGGSASAPTAPAAQSKPSAPAASTSGGAGQAGAPAASAPAAQPTAPPPLVKVTVPYTPLAASSIPLWTAFEDKRWEKHGLDVTLEYVGGATIIIQAMMSNQWDIGIISGGDMAHNRFQGGDLTMIGGYVFTFTIEPWARPDIRSAADLRGKTIPVTRFGTASHFAIISLLTAAGVRPDEVTIIQSGGNQETLAILLNNVGAAAPLAYPYNLEARKQGYHRLISFLELGEYGMFPQNAVAVREAWLKEPANRDVALRFLRGLDEGRALAKTNPTLTKDAIRKYTKVEDEAVLQETYEFYADFFPNDLLVPEASIVNMLRLLDEPPARTADPKQFYDNSLAAEIARTAAPAR